MICNSRHMVKSSRTSRSRINPEAVSEKFKKKGFLPRMTSLTVSGAPACWYLTLYAILKTRHVILWDAKFCNSTTRFGSSILNLPFDSFAFKSITDYEAWASQQEFEEVIVILLATIEAVYPELPTEWRKYLTNRRSTLSIFSNRIPWSQTFVVAAN